MPLNAPSKILYYRMFPALLKADEAYMGLEALGNGILFGILNHQCLNGSVPADPVTLARIVSAKPEEVREFLETFTKLRTLEALEGGSADRLAIPYLHRELNAIHALIEARRQAGAKGGRNTQAKTRPARSLRVVASSPAQAELEPHLGPSSTRAEQEAETDKTQSQINGSRQQRIPHDIKTSPLPPDAAAVGEKDCPEDLREGLARLGISTTLWPELRSKAGGTRGLRAALELLESKVQQKEIHSPSGFFLRCVQDLAQEGIALYDQGHSEALKTQGKALVDSRWLRLPEPCRESLEVLHGWCSWWSIQERITSSSSIAKDDLALDAWESRAAFLESCLRYYPHRSELLAAIADRQQKVPEASENPSLAKRIRISVLGSHFGLDTPSRENSKPTPLKGVAS